MLNDRHRLQCAGRFDEVEPDPEHPLVDPLRRAEALCTGPALASTVAALCVLRRRLRALGMENEEAVVAAVDGPVAVLAPGVSVLQLWKENRTVSARLWGTLSDLFAVLNRHCPVPPTP